MNVLIIDDDPIGRRVLRLTLAAHGHEVCEAVDGVEALEILHRQPVDIVISDILMPRKDGYQLCYELRRTREFRAMPVVLYSSTYTTPANEKLALGFGADRFLKKPAPADVLLATLRELMDQRDRQAVADAPPEDFHETREYSSSLVMRLEEQNVALEQTREQIMATNSHLLRRTRELEEAKAALAKMNADLERRVHERTMELENANRDLESFSYSVSHDLRAPIRAIDGFTRILLEDCAEKLTEKELRLMRRVQETAVGMNGLINSLLELARVTRASLHAEELDLTAICEEVLAELRQNEPARLGECCVAPGMTVSGDRVLVRTLLENLIGNAWKYSSKKPNPVIECSDVRQGGERIFFVRDNGAGFDMKYQDRLFTPFQRLHGIEEFPGSGVGLATVHRIIRRHGGRIWAESAVNKGATFFFTLEP
jgi:signal transduction histidine kinase